MPIINRIQRLFRADMNGILDQIEDPESMLKQAVRDMEAEITHAEVELRQVEQENKETERRLREFELCRKETEAKIHESLSLGREEIARAFVKRKLEYDRFILVLEQRKEKCQFIAKDIKDRLAERKDQLTTVKQKMEVFLVEKQTNDQVMGKEPTVNGHRLDVSSEDIDIALLRYKSGGKESAKTKKEA